MPKPPFFSIIVPIYKAEKYLQECFDSIIGQSFQDIEIILVDDGSPDKCGMIADAYALKDNRITVIHQENKGPSTARNNGLKLARGQYVSFVDSDDWIDKDLYLKAYQNLTQTDADMVICNAEFFYENGNPSWMCFNELEIANGILTERGKFETLRHFSMASWLRIYRKSFWDKMGFAFPEGFYYEDIPITLECLLCTEKISFVRDAIFHYRQRAGSIVSTMDAKILDWVYTIDLSKKVLKKYDRYVAFFPHMIWLIVPVFIFDYDHKYHKIFFRKLENVLDGQDRALIDQYGNKWEKRLVHCLHRKYGWVEFKGLQFIRKTEQKLKSWHKNIISLEHAYPKSTLKLFGLKFKYRSKKMLVHRLNSLTDALNGLTRNIEDLATKLNNTNEK